LYYIKFENPGMLDSLQKKIPRKDGIHTLVFEIEILGACQKFSRIYVLANTLCKEDIHLNIDIN